MSLASIKAKETKGKQKALPKLKTILASPYTTKSDALSEIELQELRQLICEAIEKSGQEPRVFATTTNIRLGLESSLRAINACQTSGVLLSLSIKPRFLVGLIARNCKTKNETVPVYVQAQLEQFTEEVFGVSALALALPRNMQQLGKKMENWINSHKKSRTIKTVIKKQSPKIKNKITPSKLEACEKKKTAAVPVAPPAVQDKTWSGDFLSFSNSGYSIEADKTKLAEDKDRLSDVLNEMAEKARAQQTPSEIKLNTDQMEIVAEEIEPASAEMTADSDDFLQEYQPLTVHKIRPNPDKKSKKKRKKNKKNKKM